MLLALALLLMAAIPFNAYGQSILRGLIEEEDSSSESDTVPPQRVGVPQIDMNLSDNGSSSVTGYCFDEYLIAPRRTTRFENVLAGNTGATVTTSDGRTISLKDAIDNGSIAVRALQLRVTFTNRTGSPLAVRTNGPLVLWDRPGGYVNEGALRVLRTDEGDYDWRQKMIWRNTTAERLMAVLGYYDGSVWDIDRDRFQMAAARFQRDNNLDAGGDLNDATINRLLQINNDLRGELRSIGFRDREGRSIREDLAAQIRAYQRYLGQMPTGRWSPELAARLASDRVTIPQVNALRVDGRSIADVLAANPDAGTVLTYLNGPKSLLILAETPEGTELWSRSRSRLTLEGRDARGLRKLDEAAAELALRATRGDRLVIYPRVGEEGKVMLMVGARAVEIDGASLNRYLDGGDAPKALAAVLDPMMPAPGSEMTGRRTAPKLVVYRGPLLQGRSGAATLAKAGLVQADGSRLAGALDRTYGDRAMVYLSDDLRAGASQVRTGDMGHLGRVRPGSARLAMAR